MIALAALVLALTVPPKPTEEVDDTIGAMSRAAHDNVQSEIEAFDTKTGDQVVVYIADSTGGEALEKFTIDAASAWKIGQRGRENGVILFIFKKDRRIRVEVGYGLEHALTDARSAEIINDDIAPALKAGDYDKAVEAGVGAMLSTLDASDAAPDAAIPSVQPFNPFFAVVHFIGAIFNAIGFGIWWLFRATRRLEIFLFVVFIGLVVIGLAFVYVSEFVTGCLSLMRHGKWPDASDDASDNTKARPKSTPPSTPKPKSKLAFEHGEASATAAPYTDKWGVWHENHSLDRYDEIAADAKGEGPHSEGGFWGTLDSFTASGSSGSSGGGFSGGGGSFGGGGASGSF